MKVERLTMHRCLTLAFFCLMMSFYFVGELPAQYSVVPRGSIELSVNGWNGIEELSGVTYLGNNANGSSRFAGIQDDGGQVVEFEVRFQPQGGILSAITTRTFLLSDTSLDTEGIAFSNPQRNSVFVSYERDTNASQVIPGVREYSLLTGQQLQAVGLPSVWTTDGNTRHNRGFESLTRSVDGRTMWTANEEALTIDGELATRTAGTTIRLQQLATNGNVVTPSAQFAYQVAPVHGSNPDRSGLVDLLGLPGGGLLTLERSAAASLPPFQNRIYSTQLDAATDISGAAFSPGLIGRTYNAAGKTLLWSGQVGGLLGANLEGLTLGPQLAPRKFALLGVVDNGGGTTGNLVASFELTIPNFAGDFNGDGALGCQDIDALVTELVTPTQSLAFDLNGDGIVDGEDQTTWLALAGIAAGFPGSFLPGDANLDGAVDLADFASWNAHRFQTAAGWCGGDFNYDGVVDVSDFHLWNKHKFTSIATSLVPEPASGEAVLSFSFATFLAWLRTQRYLRVKPLHRREPSVA